MLQGSGTNRKRPPQPREPVDGTLAFVEGCPHPPGIERDFDARDSKQRCCPHGSLRSPCQLSRACKNKKRIVQHEVRIAPKSHQKLDMSSLMITPTPDTSASGSWDSNRTDGLHLLIEPTGMPEGMAARSYVQARLTAQRSIEYICWQFCSCVDGLKI
jgi:hypothetical protein